MLKNYGSLLHLHNFKICSTHRTGKEGGGSGKLSSEQAEVSSCNVPALTQAGTSTLEGKKKKRSSGDDTSGHDNIHMDMDMAVEQFSLEEGKVLKNSSICL